FAPCTPPILIFLQRAVGAVFDAHATPHRLPQHARRTRTRAALRYALVERLVETCGRRAPHAARCAAERAPSAPPPRPCCDVRAYLWKIGRYWRRSWRRSAATAVENASPGPVSFAKDPSSRCSASRSSASRR